SDRRPAKTREIRVSIRRSLRSVLKDADDRSDGDHINKARSRERRHAPAAGAGKIRSTDQHAKLEPRDLEGKRIERREIERQDGLLQVEEEAIDRDQEP